MLLKMFEQCVAWLAAKVCSPDLYGTLRSRHGQANPFAEQHGDTWHSIVRRWMSSWHVMEVLPTVCNRGGLLWHLVSPLIPLLRSTKSLARRMPKKTREMIKVFWLCLETCNPTGPQVVPFVRRSIVSLNMYAIEARLVRRNASRATPVEYYKKVRKPDGSLGWQGTKQLADSAAYTDAFCQAVFSIWVKQWLITHTV